MHDEHRIQELLERAMESGDSIEDVCREDQALVGEVSRRLRRLKAFEGQLEELFPTPQGADLGERRRASGRHGSAMQFGELPQVPGYHVEDAIGHGGMGIVYRARHLRLNRPVAIKMLLAGAFASRLELECLLREAQSVAGLRHPHIVQVHDVGDVEGLPYFTMEFVEGGTLAQKLAGTPQSPRVAAETVRVLADAVAAAHRGGVVHRDLKPSNILLTGDGMLKIADFSLARAVALDPAMTITGARLGTPSYMAPEQALGRPEAMAAGVDIYALGAILYEGLTGRPPFRGETAEETRRQVVESEPAAPSRVNPRVPRDLETICLKCLRKDPARRYATAADVRDDLTRFLAGEPIHARPAGAVERCGKWARRRPAAAVLLVACAGFAVATVVGVLLWQDFDTQRRVEKAARHGRANQVIETALKDAAERRASERWSEGLRLLGDASSRLDETDDVTLEKRLLTSRFWMVVGEELASARQARLSELGGNDLAAIQGRYEAALTNAGIGIDGDPLDIAQRIRGSEIPEHLVAAIDEWAFIANDLGQTERCDRLLAISRATFPDVAWADKLRQRKKWSDASILLDIADRAAVATENRPPHLLGMLGMMLSRHADASNAGAKLPESVRRRCAATGVELLAGALRRHPNDFGVMWELGHSLRRAKRPAEAISVFRTAFAMRPTDMMPCNSLGVALTEAGETEEAVSTFQRAVELDPASYLPRQNLIFVFTHNGRWADAKQTYDAAIAADPKVAHSLPIMYAGALSDRGRYDEAVPVMRRLVEIDPEFFDARGTLGAYLFKAGRIDEAEAVLRECLTINPKHALAYAWLAWVYRDTGRRDQGIPLLARAVELSPKREFLLDLGRDFLAIGSPAEASQAFEKARVVNPEFADTWLGIASARLAMRDLAGARDAVQRAMCLARNAGDRTQVRRMIELIDRLNTIPDVAEVLEGTRSPQRGEQQAALAEWLVGYRRDAAASVRNYQELFTSMPQAREDLKRRDRLHAATAAALAGRGLGVGGEQLISVEPGALLRQAREWIGLELALRKPQIEQASDAQAAEAADALREYVDSKDLACVRESYALAEMPELERVAWSSLWTEVRQQIAAEPLEQLNIARDHLENSRWAEAAALYTALTQRGHDNAEVWYECAAAQLLAGDAKGYEETCSTMVARARPAGPLRPYLVARACTLGLRNQALLLQAAKLSENELARIDHWALTELAALSCRDRQWDRALSYLDRSDAQNQRKGNLVVNWLWRSVASDGLGDVREAERLRRLALDWLRPFNGELPSNHTEVGFHLHNWLEANALVREVVPDREQLRGDK